MLSLWTGNGAAPMTRGLFVSCVILLSGVNPAIAADTRTTSPLVVIIGMLPVVLIGAYVIIVLGGRFLLNFMKNRRDRYAAKIVSSAHPPSGSVPSIHPPSGAKGAGSK